MAKVDVVNVEGKKVGDITLSDEIFGIEPNEFAVQAVVKNYLANQRQGTQSASLSDRREQDVTDRVARQTHHRSAAE